MRIYIYIVRNTLLFRWGTTRLACKLRIRPFYQNRYCVPSSASIESLISGSGTRFLVSPRFSLKIPLSFFLSMEYNRKRERERESLFCHFLFLFLVFFFLSQLKPEKGSGLCCCRKIWSRHIRK